jgi:hypothetical protein
MTVFAGDPIAAADINLATDRRVGTLTGDSDKTAATYATEAVVDQVTINAVSGRRYRVKYVWHVVATTTTNLLYVRIREGWVSSGSPGSQLVYSQHQVPTNIESNIIEADWTAPSTGTFTFTATAFRQSGSTNSTFRGAPSQPRSLTVEYAA